jgi:hypothetical protein
MVRDMIEAVLHACIVLTIALVPSKNENERLDREDGDFDFRYLL